MQSIIEKIFTKGCEQSYIKISRSRDNNWNIYNNESTIIHHEYLEDLIEYVGSKNIQILWDVLLQGSPERSMFEMTCLKKFIRNGDIVIAYIDDNLEHIEYLLEHIKHVQIQRLVVCSMSHIDNDNLVFMSNVLHCDIVYRKNGCITTVFEYC